MSSPEASIGLLPKKIGPYRIDGRLGQGGMGIVYRGHDERLGRPVALKQIRPDAVGDERVRGRFLREARSTAKLDHPSLVRFYDLVRAGEDESAGGSDWLVLELVDGRPLSELIEAGPLSPATAVRLAGEIAEGLAAAHRRRLVHRDLKPENVMVTGEGHAKILDFGLVKPLRTADEPRVTAITLTLEGKILGTVRSLSPEQALGQEIDGRSDLFALGSLLYEMLTGKHPFDEGGSTLETLTRICSKPHAKVTEENPAVPWELSALVDHLLEKEPERRPATAFEVAAALRDLEDGIGGGTRRERPAEEAATDLAWLDEEADRGGGGKS